MIFPFGCYSFVITKWHEENPNDWCAISREKDGKLLYDRDMSLVALAARIKERGIEVVYTKAWTSGISKDYPITK